MEALHLCMDWTVQILEAVKTGASPSVGPFTSVRVLDMEDQERLVRMAGVAVLDLPKPLQTLLAALRELKLDVARDNVRARANMESRIRSFCESRVAYICESFNTAIEAIRRCNEDVWATVLEAEPHFDHELRALLEVESLGPPSEWQATLIAASRRFQETLAKTTLSERPVVREAPRMDYDSVHRATDAVRASQDMRQRLIDLATGPLVRLFEPTDGQARPTVAPIDVLVPGSVVTKQDKTLAAQKLQTAQKLLRRLQRSIAVSRASRDVLYEDAVSSLIWALRQATVGPEAHVISLEDTDPVMKTADSKLQKEIAFVLQTLTVDRSSLDIVLRSIKAQTVAIEGLAARESATFWNVQLTQWASRINECGLTYVDALRSEPVSC